MHSFWPLKREEGENMLVFMIPGQFQSHSVIGSKLLSLRLCTASKHAWSPHGPLINAHDAFHKIRKGKKKNKP